MGVSSVCSGDVPWLDLQNRGVPFLRQRRCRTSLLPARISVSAGRQKGADAAGRFERDVCEAVSKEMSFLEMVDVLNERLLLE